MSRASVLYQVNTRLVLAEVGPRSTLDDLPDATLDLLAERGVDLVYLLGVWQTGPAGRQVSARDPEWRKGFLRLLPDLQEADIVGSPFAIRAYTPHRDFGGEAGLARLRQRLARRGMRLILDFVPNHVALDHPWVHSRPDYLIAGTEDDLRRAPHNYLRLEGHIRAHGRDPYFPGWPDTLQLNYRHAGLRQAMAEELRRVAGMCDGVRCDMAMLLLPDVFRATWGEASRPADGSTPVDAPFWPEAIAAVRRVYPAFLFLAEVYWDLEWALQQQGFDYTYDKRLYDRLRAGQAGAVHAHLTADLAFQSRCVRFLENHDEPRAATAFPPGPHQAAAVLTYMAPGLKFFHEGQWEGRRAQASVHLGRRPVEVPDAEITTFYARLLAVLKRPEIREGNWELLACLPAWEGNTTHDQFVAFRWRAEGGRQLLTAVDYGPTQGQCYVVVPGLTGRVVLRDLCSGEAYERDGGEMGGRGLYLDVPPWKGHVFVME